MDLGYFQTTSKKCNFFHVFYPMRIFSSFSPSVGGGSIPHTPYKHLWKYVCTIPSVALGKESGPEITGCPKPLMWCATEIKVVHHGWQLFCQQLRWNCSLQSTFFLPKKNSNYYKLFGLHVFYLFKMVWMCAFSLNRNQKKRRNSLE